MIIKSMSRKEASFGQLMDYIDRDGGEERYRIRHNLLARDRDRVRDEFEYNAAHMRDRKNGVFMYHEIISITRAKGIDLATQKERLHQIAQEYVAARAPRSLCYGGLHDDKDHSLHYHLMISANRSGEQKRHRLSKEQFRSIQVGLERHVLSTYPELEQTLAIEKQAEGRVSRKEAELKRRTGRSPEREPVRDRVLEALAASEDRHSLLKELEASGLTLYVRGQNIGIMDLQTGKRHRVKTLDASLPALLEKRMSFVVGGEKPAAERHNSAEEKQSRNVESETRTQAATERNTPEDGNERPESHTAAEKEIEPEIEKNLSSTQQEWRDEIERHRKAERRQEREIDKER